MLTFRHLIYLADAGTRQDVVKLIDQQFFPDAVQPLDGIILKFTQGQEIFGFPKALFQQSIPALGSSLSGVGSSMNLEVKLSRPHRQLILLLGDPCKAMIRPTEFDFWHSFQVLLAKSTFNHFGSGTATTITHTKRA